jgi:Mrp family chromosome partitioning ATPase
MKSSATMTNPFLVIRATVETEIPAPGILAISSALAGDGKTAVSAGIARSLAAGGYRTLVLDAGNPIDSERAVTREALTEQAAHERLSHAVRATASGCDYLALRDLGADVSSSVAIAALYAAVRARYQYAVVDTSVLNGDGLALARGADGVVLAVREGRAIVPADGEAVDLLNRLHVRFLGVVATTDRQTSEFSSDTNLPDRLKHRTPPPLVSNDVPTAPIKNRLVARLRNALPLFGRVRQTVPARTSTRE